jgi:hypothetical protein
MLRFRVKVSGVEKGKEETINAARKVLMMSMFKMEELAIKNAPFDVGDLRQKITVFPEILANHYVLTSHAEYSAALEYGTRPFYAPIEPLKKWAARKIGDESVAYAVRAKIAKEGITAHPFMRPAYYEVLNFWYPKFRDDVFSDKI